ncbi:uncharacterized protein TRIREDRAFT_106051 [Trichoderma reesei QM6a]|uniref:Predicted protein n=2 Tax=Hypocrea jecorina TaxID=51453 RepID=G0RG76_HYPJQ|nr:uncharacterized protein TRIREDRAFT_106051 [Trichoderma reesei QM6a]EGR49809.1 predicted protein [Trichoderma reesei QM6a]ETS03433.1 hypothetical protein M419DRAFT_76200 [Trichoderma reesei RUT C-30]
MAATVGSRLLAPWVGDQNPPPSPLASNPVVFRRYSTGIDLLEGSSKKNRRSSVIDPAMALRNLKNSYISKVHGGGGGGGGGVDDDDEVEDERSRNRTKRYSRDDTTTLAEFLKNHEPPPSSYMSVPFGHADDKDQESKWSRFKALKKRSKSVPRPPQNIQLPDSAVSGLTIGGHRHIAISIPLEALPFSSDPNSTTQSPANAGNQANNEKAGGQRDEHGTLPRNYVVQTYSEENGTVTVLPAATNEVRARSKAPPAHRFSLFPPQSSSLSPTGLPQRCSLPPTSTVSQPAGMPTDDPMGFSARSKRDSKHSSYSTISPKRTDPPTPTHIAMYAQGTAAWGAGAAQSPPQSPAKTNTQRKARASSMVITTTGQKHLHPALSPSIDGRLSVASGIELARDGYNKKPLPKPPAVSDPRAKQKRRSGVGYPSPITEELTDGSTRSNRRSVRRAVSSQSMMPASPEMPSRPSTAGSIQSRRDKVREKKRRDMEAVRNAKALKDLQRRQSVDQHNEQEGGGQGHDASGNVQQPLRNAKAQEEDGRPRMSSINTLCPVVVVVDLQPSPGLPDEKTARKASPPPSPLPMPSPSPDKSQMRISRDIDSELYLQQKRNMMDEQILRLYDSYHENRLRDVERRIRRLERNGDVWLRALVPVLDDMSRNLKAIQPSSRIDRDADANGDGRGWVSDDEVSGASAERKARSTKRAKTPTRRASLSRGRIMAGLIGRRLASDDSGSDTMSRSDEMGGLGLIEPLMRELAGEARRRQQQLAERTADDWRHNTV